MDYKVLYWEDIEEGQELPPIVYELSLLRLVAIVRASGVYDYVHFDRDYAQAAGTRDVFIATHHVAGLFSRLLTDWSGPEADIRALTFSMLSQSCSNDILTITGRVGRKYINDQGEYLVDVVDMNMAHELAPQAATATATMVFPSREGGPVKISERKLELPEMPLDPNMPDFAKSMMKAVKEGAKEPERPLTADEIHLWCEAVEDWNPLYWDEEFATKSRHGGIISPPAAMFFGAGSSAHMGVGYLKPGAKVPEAVKKGLTGLPLQQALREDMIAFNTPFMPPECPEIAVAQARSDYYRPLRPGDSSHTKQRLLNCTAKKKTRLGEGYFMTWVNEVYNQKEELVRTFTLTSFFYHI